MTKTIHYSDFNGFSQMPWLDGQPAKLVHLSNQNGMQMVFMDIGANWLSCQLPLANQQGELGREVLLRSPNMSEHLAQTAYFGAVVGRFANRIRKGTFELGGKRFQLDINNGENSLHGGENGFDRKRWQILAQDNHRVVFGLRSENGDGGYPGNFNATVEYCLTENNQLLISYEASADETTAVNLTNHAYFNLAGIDSSKTVFEHQVQIMADRYLPVDESLIPTGVLQPVEGSAFDLRILAKVSDEFDHAFIFENGISNGEQIAAKAISPNGDLTMNVKTTKPAVQFYTGNFLAGTVSLQGEYARNQGFALETQYFPDGPNHPEWGTASGILPAGKCYKHHTIYEFIF